MSTGFLLTRKVCKIGKTHSNCTKKDCDNCRHWIDMEVWQDCTNCKNQCDDCPLK